MAKDETASRRLAEENLRRAFGDLLPKLQRAYGQPAGDAAEMRSRHAVALLAIADFLNRMGPDYLAHFADQFAKLAQTLQDLNEGVRAPMLYPALAKRSDQTPEEAAREHLVRAATSEHFERLLFIMNHEDDPELSEIDNKRFRYARILWAMDAYFHKIDHDKLPELGTYIAGLGVSPAEYRRRGKQAFAKAVKSASR
jgi:hypothetical protein